MSKITNIIKELQQAIKDTNLKIEDELVFKEALITYRSQEQRLPEKKEQSNNLNEPITEKQRNYIAKNSDSLKKRGFDIENIQYKRQASKIIKEYIKILNNSNG